MSDQFTVTNFKELKYENEPIVMLTAYDYPTASILEEAGIDSILVGDSVSNVILGYKNTIPVTMDEMISHTRSVSRATERPLIIGDMPFLSYQISEEDAVKNSGRFLKEGGASAVKVEGGREVADKINAIIKAGIPVMGHIGLTPQWINRFGGYKIQGKTKKAAQMIIEDAEKLEEIGVFGIVLESIPKEVSKIITEKIKVPTIGIGAGPHCDGQILVIHDVLGLSELSPKFARKYLDLTPKILTAVKSFIRDVKNQRFPKDKHSFTMKKGEFNSLKKYLKQNEGKQK